MQENVLENPPAEILMETKNSVQNNIYEINMQSKHEKLTIFVEQWDLKERLYSKQ